MKYTDQLTEDLTYYEMSRQREADETFITNHPSTVEEWLRRNHFDTPEGFISSIEKVVLDGERRPHQGPLEYEIGYIEFTSRGLVSPQLASQILRWENYGSNISTIMGENGLL